jgi:hypothetical protein
MKGEILGLPESQRASTKFFILSMSLFVALNNLAAPVLAEKTLAGTGLAYGRDHAYFITAPSGWILDTESGAGQGVFAVFYPEGSNWDGPAVMYTNAAARDGQTPLAAINKDLKAMREHSPNLKVTDGGTISTKDKKLAPIRFLSNDSHGNYEAAGYVTEKNIVANIILTTRDKKSFDSALPAFRKLVGSYRFVSDDPSKLDLPALWKEERKRNDGDNASKANNTKLIHK